MVSKLFQVTISPPLYFGIALSSSPTGDSTPERLFTIGATADAFPFPLTSTTAAALFSLNPPAPFMPSLGSHAELHKNQHVHTAMTAMKAVKNHAPALSALVGGGISAPVGTEEELWPAVGSDALVPPVEFVKGGGTCWIIVAWKTSNAHIC